MSPPAEEGATAEDVVEVGRMDRIISDQQIAQPCRPTSSPRLGCSCSVTLCIETRGFVLGLRGCAVPVPGYRASTGYPGTLG